MPSQNIKKLRFFYVGHVVLQKDEKTLLLLLKTWNKKTKMFPNGNRDCLKVFLKLKLYILQEN